MARQPWSTAEQIYLRDHYATMTVREIASVLGRTPHSVKDKVEYMGLKKPRRHKPKPPKPARVKPKRVIPPGVRDWLVGYVD